MSKYPGPLSDSPTFPVTSSNSFPLANPTRFSEPHPVPPLSKIISSSLAGSPSSTTWVCLSQPFLSRTEVVYFVFAGSFSELAGVDAPCGHCNLLGDRNRAFLIPVCLNYLHRVSVRLLSVVFSFHSETAVCCETHVNPAMSGHLSEHSLCLAMLKQKPYSWPKRGYVFSPCLPICCVQIVLSAARWSHIPYSSAHPCLAA